MSLEDESWDADNIDAPRQAEGRIRVKLCFGLRHASWDCQRLPSVPLATFSKVLALHGYDATSHFETTVDDVLDMYTRITGKILDLDKMPDKV